MAELAERLRRLRAQAGAPSEPAPVRTAPTVDTRPPAMPAQSKLNPPPASMDGLKALLRRQVARSGQGPVSSVVAGPPSAGGEGVLIPELPDVVATTTQAPGTEICPGLFEHRELLTIATPVPWLWLPDLHPQLLPTDALLHFDTETTGLAGGTGTRAFMLGFARWRPDGLEVRQLWINALGAEPVMLERFAQWLSKAAFQLVSYNGRSFDAPLLRARYRLCRQRDPLEGLPHHDLLHAVRRRFRREWPSCRLAEAEARLLGVRRLDDLPGAAAPAAFLQALRGGGAAPLQRVRAHHFQDLVSLAGLLPRLCELAFRAPCSWSLQAARNGRARG